MALSKEKSGRRNGRGFTLVEAVTAVAIASIVSAVALPSYTQYLHRGQLGDGLSQLATLRVRLEQYHPDHRNYGAATCADTDSPTWAQFPIVNGSFTITCALGDRGQQFTLTATGSGKAKGFVYTLDDTGWRTTRQFAGTAVSLDCWSTRSPGACDD